MVAVVSEEKILDFGDELSGRARQNVSERLLDALNDTKPRH